MSGQKIIDGLKSAISGDWHRVTIEGQIWVRANAGDMDDTTQRLLKELDDASTQNRIAMIGVDYSTHRDQRAFLAECVRRCCDLKALPENTR